jgi:hypothetical protein
MEPISIPMKKAKQTKRFDVYEAEKSDAHITTVYINKAAGAAEFITLTIAQRMPL